MLAMLLLSAISPTLSQPISSVESTDIDSDGLLSWQEALLGTSDNDSKDPGLYCIYKKSYKTRDYNSWHRYSDQNGTFRIALNRTVVRRGTELEFNGLKGAKTSIKAAKDELDELEIKDEGWTVRIPQDNTVGKYTFTASKNDWSRSIEIFVVFDPYGMEISSKNRRAYCYDENGERDEKGYIYTKSGNLHKGELYPFGDNLTVYPDLYEFALAGVGKETDTRRAAVKLVRIVAQRNTALPREPPQLRDPRHILFYDQGKIEGLTLKDASKLARNGVNIDDLASEGSSKTMNNWCDECAFALTGLLRSIGIPSRILSIHPTESTQLMGHYISEAWFDRPLLEASYIENKGDWFALDADEWNAEWYTAEPTFWMPMGECYASRSNYGFTAEHLFRVNYEYRIAHFYVLGREEKDPSLVDVTSAYKGHDMIELQYGNLTKFKSRGGGDFYKVVVENGSRLSLTTSGPTKSRIYINEKDYPALKISYQGYPPKSPNKNLTGKEVYLDPGTYYVAVFAPEDGDNSIEGNYGSYTLSLEKASPPEDSENGDKTEETKRGWEKHPIEYSLGCVLVVLWVAAFMGKKRL